MGKLIVISGENNSGKSLYAEGLVANAGKNLYYIATMIPRTDENRRRIEKHIRQRAGLHFHTLEQPYTVRDVPLAEGAIVLLEDVSNLLANVIFEKKGTADDVFKEIIGLQSRCKILAVVTIAGLESEGYEGETVTYINSLNRLNEKLEEQADVCISMKDGNPIFEKGEWPYAD